MGIQYDYCTAIEEASQDDSGWNCDDPTEDEIWDYTTLIFDDPEVKAYLEEFGIRYVGNYLLEADDWGGGVGGKRFVTFLNPELQLGCLLLWDKYKNSFPCLSDDISFDNKHLAPVLKKRDVYLHVSNYTDIFWLIKLAEEGVEVRIGGKSSTDMKEDEFMHVLLDIEHGANYLTREIDRKVFPEELLRPFEPLKLQFDEFEEFCKAQYGDGEFEWDYVKKEHPEYNGIRIFLNGKTNFNGYYRKYPIHYLFLIDEKWNYISYNSDKNPSFIELLMNAVLNPLPYEYKKQNALDISGVEQIFAMVLDCNETCDVTEYWKHICFLVKYDIGKGILEICDEKEGLWEFHELLQQSVDL